MNGEVLASAGANIRDNLVTTAVKFLTNPNVQRCTLESKERFLRSKGLTDLEIQKAIEKCGEIMDIPSMTSELMFFHHSRRSWFRENVLPLIIYGGFAYGCYWFYKNCIRHLLFVEEPKRKSTAECIEELRKSLDILNSNVSSLRGEMQTSVQQNALRTQLDVIKSDIASVKGILLNRNQFPTLKKRSDPPSIPDWQRQSEEATSTEAAADEKKKPHRSRSQRSESGGSNSSEGEQATKNSDSSLEIMDMPSKVDIIQKPSPPKDAYKMWLNSTAAIDQLKAAYPGLKYTELIRKGSEVWTSVDQSEWEKKAAIAKEDYMKELEKYIWNHPSKFNIYDKPRQPMTAYMLWLNSGARERIKAENVGREVTEIARIGGEIWRSMDQSEWNEKTAKAKEQYITDLEAIISKQEFDDEEK